MVIANIIKKSGGNFGLKTEDNMTGWYLKNIHKHICLKEINNEQYYVRTCKACKERDRLAKARKELEDMMRMSISWDSDCILL
jgi:hypothetical protein